MGAPPPHHLLLPPKPADLSSVQALVSHPQASSSPAPADLASPPPLPASSPHPAGLAFHPQFDRLDLSSSSSSSSLVPEIYHVPTKKKNQGLKRRDRDSKLENNGEKRKQRRPPNKSSFRNDRRGCQENVCCKCAAGFTADCAAVCCCPLAVLHLLALTFIKLPSAVVWRMLVNMKNRLCSKSLPPDVHEEDDSRPDFTPPWSYKDSPEGSDPLAHVVRFDSQKLWKHFETGHLGFGGLSMKRE